jgi:hypothetical protein
MSEEAVVDALVRSSVNDEEATLLFDKDEREVGVQLASTVNKNEVNKVNFLYIKGIIEREDKEIT